MKSNLASSVKKGKLTKEAADAVAARVKGTLEYSDFGSVDMVSLAIGCLRLTGNLHSICRRPPVHLRTPGTDLRSFMEGALTMCHALRRWWKPCWRMSA